MWKSKIKIKWSTQVTQWRNWGITIAIYLTPRSYLCTYICMYVWNQIQLLYHLIYFCLSAAYLFCIPSSTDCNWIWFWNSEISGIFFWGALSLSIWHMHGKQCDFIRRHTVSSNFIVWPPLLCLSLSLSSFGQATRTLHGGGASEFLFGNAYAWNDIISMLQTMAQRSKSLSPPCTSSPCLSHVAA